MCGTAERMSLGEIMRALGCAPPYVDSAGQPIRSTLLWKKFYTPFSAMSPTSGTRRELVTAASAAVHAVLSMLAPDPLDTAAALAIPRQRSKASDPLRLALVTSAQPTGRVLDQLIAASPVAWRRACCAHTLPPRGARSRWPSKRRSWRR